MKLSARTKLVSSLAQLKKADGKNFCVSHRQLLFAKLVLRSISADYLAEKTVKLASGVAKLKTSGTPLALFAITT